MNLAGTNHVTVDAADIKTGRLSDLSSTVPKQLTTETGPLKHGIYIVAVHNVDYFLNTFGGDPAVSKTNGMLFGLHNPIFIPIKDPSVIYVISDTNAKRLTYIMY